ncbi:MAG: hypothetical protein Q9219_007708 [cf. Caloplaca sp. 3 TL-2023]
MADYEYSKRPGIKRLEKMGDRTLSWIQAMSAGLEENSESSADTALFAPMLPIEAHQQAYYLDTLQQELGDRIAGLVIYDTASVDAIPADMRHLIRLAMTEVHGPHDILDQVSLGLDVFLPSFVGEATDAGLALSFTFPISEKPRGGRHFVLGFNLWLNTYSTDLAPLVEACECYTCTNHHRAYIRHLLDAKEMLAWVLLQIHNYHIMDLFFNGVRYSISKGTYQQDCEVFETSYERDFPASAGQRPR